MRGSTRVDFCSFLIILGFLFIIIINQFNSLIQPSPVVAGVARVHAWDSTLRSRHARQAEPAPPLACWSSYFFKQMAVRYCEEDQFRAWHAGCSMKS